MRLCSFFILPFFFLVGCSETNLDDLDEGELDEIESQVEKDATSLTEAADEAVKLLEEEIQSELDSDGIGTIADTVPDAEAADAEES